MANFINIKDKAAAKKVEKAINKTGKKYSKNRLLYRELRCTYPQQLQECLGSLDFTYLPFDALTAVRKSNPELFNLGLAEYEAQQKAVIGLLQDALAASREYV